MPTNYTMYCSPGKTWDHLLHSAKVRHQRKTNRRVWWYSDRHLSSSCTCFSFCGKSTELMLVISQGAGQVTGSVLGRGDFIAGFGPPAWSRTPRQFHGWVWPFGCTSNKRLWQPRGATAREWNYCISYPLVSCHSSLLVIIGQDVSTSKTDSVWWLLVSDDHLVKCHLHYGATENRAALSWRDNMLFTA